MNFNDVLLSSLDLVYGIESEFSCALILTSLQPVHVCGPFKMKGKRKQDEDERKKLGLWRFSKLKS